MKKIILLIVCLLLLCGCTADVDLEINDDTLSESVTINYFADGYNSKDDIKESFREYVPVYNSVIVADTEPDEKKDGVEYFNRTLKEMSNGYIFNYKYNYPLVSYNSSRTLKKAFKSASLVKNKVDGTIVLSTDSNGLKLFEEYDELTSVNIRIKTNNEVLESNGKYKDGVYIWTFNRNDYKKNIYMKMKSNNNTKMVYGNKENTKEESFFSKIVNKNPILSVIIGVGLFILVIFVLSKITKKFNN